MSLVPALFVLPATIVSISVAGSAALSVDAAVPAVAVGTDVAADRAVR